jgi:hypothetical protein
MSFSNQPLSTQGRRPPPAWLFAIFILMGLVFFYFFFLRPAMKVLAARNWPQVPRVIESSSVGSHRGNKGGITYSVDITYSYRVGGRFHSSDRYGFMGGSSSGFAGKEAIVERYPAGSKAMCYVNPADPLDAVIERRFTNDMFFGLIPLAFTAAGAVGLKASRKKAAPSDAAIAWEPKVMRAVGDFRGVSTEAIEMRPAATPVAKLRTMLIFALFWNGFMSFFVFMVSGHGHIRQLPVPLMLFFSVFFLAGLALIAGVVKAFMALFNPKVHLRLKPGALKPGADFEVEWQIAGGSRRLSQLGITLECREEAVYPAGKQDGTAKEVCYRAELVNTAQREELGSGTAKGRTPDRAMHSLDTGRNRVIWTMRVKGKVPHWPGIEDEYPVVMLPERWKEAT